MEHLQHGMRRKWDRHYRTTNTIMSITLIIFGIFFMLPLVVIYPQYFMKNSFNSRLLYHLIIDAEDYWNCNKDYNSFVNHIPNDDDELYTIYVFSITNAKDVLQVGAKPIVAEMGPYGYKKNTFKYDISFDNIDQSTITYKEYTLLQPMTTIKELETCTRIFYAMERDKTSSSNICELNKCNCKSHEQILTILNPLFLKLLHEDTSEEIIGRLSSEVFTHIKYLLSENFINAIKSYLVPFAYREIGEFRQLVQLSKILNTGFNYMLNLHLSYDDIDTIAKGINGAAIVPTSCGLSIYGINSCPFGGYLFFSATFAMRPYELYNNTMNDLPSTLPFFNKTNYFSFMNFEIGMPKWVGVCTYLKSISFNANRGFSTATDNELNDIYQEIIYNYTLYINNNDITKITNNKLLLSKIMVDGFCSYLFSNFWNRYGTSLRILSVEEFRNTSDAVPCSPLLSKCIWQWGYMEKYGINKINISTALATTMADVILATNTNPNSLFYAPNSRLLYNTFKYCHQVLRPAVTNTKCMDIEYARENATISIPANLWAVDYGISTRNMTYLYYAYKSVVKSQTLQQKYIDFACEFADLPYEKYVNYSGFHDDFVIRYLNKHKDPLFEHNFTIGKWDEFGLAQWGGGKFFIYLFFIIF